jgi:hypothetical protein
LPARDGYRQNTLFRLRRTQLIEHLRQREADALIVSGSETDVCVLATVLDAVDIGYRVIVVRDAVCSSSDEGHDMLVSLVCSEEGQRHKLCANHSDSELAASSNLSGKPINHNAWEPLDCRRHRLDRDLAVAPFAGLALVASRTRVPMPCRVADDHPEVGLSSSSVGGR